MVQQRIRDKLICIEKLIISDRSDMSFPMILRITRAVMHVLVRPCRRVILINSRTIAVYYKSSSPPARPIINLLAS